MLMYLRHISCPNRQNHAWRTFTVKKLLLPSTQITYLVIHKEEEKEKAKR